MTQFENRCHVLLGLGEWRDAAVSLNRAPACVVGSQREHDRVSRQAGALRLVVQEAHESGLGIDGLAGVERIRSPITIQVTTPRTPRLRHELRDPLCAAGRSGHPIPAGLLLHLRRDQAGIHARALTACLTHLGAQVLGHHDIRRQRRATGECGGGREQGGGTNEHPSRVGKDGRVFDIVLVHPQIAPNTGNIMRLCANTGARLHLIRPLGFTLSDRRLERAGLDYRDRAVVRVHNSWAEAATDALAGRRMFAVDTSGSTTYSALAFQPGDVFVFGSEPHGLSEDVLEYVPSEHRLRIPMQPQSRSLNLSNSVAVIVCEAWRQNGFSGAN